MIEWKLVEGDGEVGSQVVYGGAFHQDSDREKAGAKGRVKGGEFSFRHVEFVVSVCEIAM